MAEDYTPQPNYYAVIPAPIMYDKRLKSSAKLLYAQISALTTREGYCWATNTYFTELNDVDVTTISRLLSQLAEYGHIIIEIDRQGGNKRKIFITNSSTQNTQDLIAKKSIPHSKIAMTPLASTSSGQKPPNIISNTITIVSTKVLTVKRPIYGNREIEYILSKYEECLGHKPTDKSPRNAAHNMRQSLHKMLQELEGTGFTSTFEHLVDKVFIWYIDKYGEMGGENIATMYRKVKNLLIPATIKKYALTKRVSLREGSPQEVRGYAV